jgi:hypothetical protein
MKWLFTKLLTLFFALALLSAMLAISWATCLDRPACKGKPGYRAPDGRCVAFKNLVKTCGAYPHSACTFENAPGTGANKECALAPKSAQKKENAPEKARPEEQDPDNPDNPDYEDDEE